LALGACIVRDDLGAYDVAWYLGGALCEVAGGLSLMVKRSPAAVPV